MNRQPLFHWLARWSTGAEAETPDDAGQRSDALEISRRAFIGWSGAASIGLSFFTQAVGAEGLRFAPGGGLLLPEVRPDFVKRVIRPADLLALTFEFYNFRPALKANGEYDLIPDPDNP